MRITIETNLVGASVRVEGEAGVLPATTLGYRFGGKKGFRELAYLLSDLATTLGMTDDSKDKEVLQILLKHGDDYDCKKGKKCRVNHEAL